MMMTGMAGEAILETQLRASLLLWVLYLALRCGAAAIWRTRQQSGVAWLAWCACLVLLLFFLQASLHDPQQMYIVFFVLIALILFFGIAIASKTTMKITNRKIK
jgi:hypothetical protein